MRSIWSSMIARSDTLFGVCETLGRDFGISPNWFRVAFAAVVIYNLELAFIAYASVGVLVALGHLVYPNAHRAPAPAPVEAQAAPVEAEVAVEIVEQEREPALAAA